MVSAKVSLEGVHPGGHRRELELMADTGALYSMVPEALLGELGVQPVQKLEFELANGSVIERNVGEARFIYDGGGAVSPVMLGEEGDAAVLGVVALESMGLEVDPVRKAIRPTLLQLD